MCNILDQRKSTKLYKEMGHLVGIHYKTFRVRINRSDVMKQATEEGMLANWDEYFFGSQMERWRAPRCETSPNEQSWRIDILIQLLLTRSCKIPLASLTWSTKIAVQRHVWGLSMISHKYIYQSYWMNHPSAQRLIIKNVVLILTFFLQKYRSNKRLCVGSETRGTWNAQTRV